MCVCVGGLFGIEYNQELGEKRGRQMNEDHQKTDANEQQDCRSGEQEWKQRMGERVTGEFENGCASDILKEKPCFLVHEQNEKKRKGLIFMDEVMMRNCPCQVSRPK